MPHSKSALSKLLLLLPAGLGVAAIAWLSVSTDEQDIPETQALTVAEHFEFDQLAGDGQQQEATYQRMLADGIGTLAADDLQVAGDPQEKGAWEPAFELPLIPIHASLLTDGRVLNFGLYNHDGNTVSPVAIWDPLTGETTRADLSTGGNGYLFCSGMSKMSDGRLFVAGGTVGNNVPIRKTNIFDSLTDTWEWGPTMASGRWYDSVTAMSNGEMLIVGGGPSTPEVRQVNGALRRLTGISNNVTGNISQHPWVQQSPRGGAVYLGPRKDMFHIDTEGSGNIEFLGSTSGTRNYGNAVMYDEGKMLLVSGNTSNTAEIVTLDSATPTIEQIAGPAIRRHQGNSTLLADGKVLVTGGNNTGSLYDPNSSVFEAEIWDPETRQFSTMASMKFTRQYHSTALLLPDGRVYSAGGQQGQSYALRNAEIFLPPYLFDKFGGGELADRPLIASAPYSVNYGQSIDLDVQTDLPIAKLTLIRPGSVTHSTNMEQRAVAAPSVYLGDGKVRWTTPANSLLAPPGFYMLFAVDSDGVPSVARMVQIGANLANVFEELQFANPGFQASSDQEEVALQLKAFSSGGLDLTYSSDSLPPGLEIDSATGLITGTPYLTGTSSAVVQVTDSADRSETVTFQWQVVGVPPTGEPLESDLSGYWPIYDSSSVESDATDGVDVVGGDDAVAEAQAVFVDDATRGRVALLDGDSYLRLPVDVSESSASYSLWFKTAVGNRPLLSSSTDDAGSNTDRILFLESDGLSATLNGQKISGGRNYADNSWHHVLYSHGSSGQSLYVDGELIADGSRNSSSQSAQRVLLVGSNPADTALRFDGMIDDIRYYDTELDGSDAFLLRNNEDNTAPTLSAIANRTGLVGQTVSLQLQASDAEGQTLRYFVQSLPNGLQLDSSTGLVSGVLASANVFTVNFTVRDTTGATAAQSMRWTVDLPVQENRSPTMVPFVSQNSIQGRAISMATQASDPDGDSLQYSASGLPAGLAIALSDGIISGTPSQIGDYGVTVTATDPDGLSVSQTFTWSITDDPATLGLPVLTTENPPVPVESGETALYSATAASGSAVQYQWSFGDGSTDTAWSSSGSASHTFAKPGLYSVTVFAKNAAGNESRLQFSQTVYATPTPNRPLSSSGLVIDDARGRVWVANPDNNSVSLVGEASQERLREITVGEQPVSLALTDDGSVWVSNKGSASISVIDGSSLSVSRTYNLAAGSQPHGLLVDGNRAYVALESTGQVQVINTTNGQTIRTAIVAPRVRGLAMNSDRNQLMASRYITPLVDGESTVSVDLSDGAGELYVLSADTLAQQRVVELPVSFAGDSEVSGNGLPNYLAAPVISPDGLAVWVPSKQDNIGRGTRRNSASLNHQNTVRAVVSKVLLTDWSHTWQNRVDLDNSSVSSAAAFDSNGNFLLVALETSAELAIIDAHDNGILGRVAVGRAPSAVAVSADGSKVWVHNFVDRSLSVIDTSSFFAGSSAQPTLSATVSLVSNEQLDVEVLRGKQLFYDASDDRLALENYISCASCHNDADHDGRVWDFSQFGEGLRSTTSLRGKGAAAHGMLHWSGNFDEFHDFEGQIRQFAGGTGLMSNGDFAAANEPLGATKTGRSVDLDALAAYLTSLDSMPVNPQKGADFSDAAERGKQLFDDQSCATCHSGAAMTDSATARRHDVGTIKASSGSRLSGDLDGLDTPTLLNLHENAPYLHDGSASTVAQAIASHSESASLTASELADLQRYLLEIPADGDTRAALLELADGDSKSASVGEDEWHFYRFEAGDNINEVIFELSGLSSDIDLYVRADVKPSGGVEENGIYDAASTNGGISSERVSVVNSAATTWYVGVHGYRAGDFTVSARAIESVEPGVETLLQSGVPVSGTVLTSQWQYFKISAGDNIGSIEVDLSGLTADSDVYVRRGARPTGHVGNSGVYDCQSIYGGTASERCVLSNSEASDWYIGVYGYQGSPFALKATLVENTGGGGGTDDDNRELTIAQRTNDNIAAGDWHYYALTLPPEAISATVTLTGLTADIDLYVRRDQRPSGSVGEGGTYDCGSFVGGSNDEQCIVGNAADADLLIGVHGYQAGAYQLMVEVQSEAGVVITPLANDDVSLSSVEQAEWRYYSYTASAAELRVDFVLDQMNADADLYVRKDELPSGDPNTGANSDCVSLRGGTQAENCTLANTGVNTWYVGVYGYQASPYRLQINGLSTRALQISKPSLMSKGEMLKETAEPTDGSNVVKIGGGGSGDLALLLLTTVGLWQRRRLQARAAV